MNASFACSGDETVARLPGVRNPQAGALLDARHAGTTTAEGRLGAPQFLTRLAAEGVKHSKGSPCTDVRFQPLNYAGSPITLELMYRHMEENDPRLAQKNWGCTAYRDARPSTFAVRNRARRAVELAVKVLSSFVGPADVASYAAGTGLFASMLMQRLTPNRVAEVRIRLFDVDPWTVLTARSRFPWQGPLKAVSDWTKLLDSRTYDTNTGYLNGRFAFAECLGMFDDLPDELARSGRRNGRVRPAYGHAMRHLFSTIHPGGMLVIGNFAPTHPAQPSTGPGSTSLIPWDEEEMERLVREFGVLAPSRGDTIEFERVKGAEDSQMLMVLRKGESNTVKKR